MFQVGVTEMDIKKRTDKKKLDMCANYFDTKYSKRWCVIRDIPCVVVKGESCSYLNRSVRG